jgi:hypothetical protein
MRRMAVVLAWALTPSRYNRGGAMRSFTCFLGLVFVMLVGSPSIGAQETGPTSEAPSEFVDCVNPSFLSNALIECTGLGSVPSLEPAVADATVSEIDASEATVLTATSSTASEAIIFPSYCRVKVDAVFWGGRQWLELAEALAGDYSQCAEYYITIPPRDGNKTQLRVPARFEEVRVLNPRIHPVAEINVIAWRAWVREFPTRTFYSAGVTARRRMAAAGLDVTRGETWALNELSQEVLENVPERRAEILEFLHGLYDGEPGMPKARGIVFNIGLRSSISVSEATAYKASLQVWLADGPFWSGLNTYVDFFAHEVYASSLNWGVAGAPRARRAEYLNDYFHHMTILAEEGPETVEAARQFLRRTYLPLANAFWPHPNVGNTNLLSAETMSQFISTQVYAMRHYANAHPQTAPQGRIGFGWAPIAEAPGYSEAGRNMIRTRLASAIHESSEEGTNSQMGACGPPGEHVWCEGDVDLAQLNDAWKVFASWD